MTTTQGWTDTADWTYTLADARTGVELATLPLVDVKYDRALSGVGKLDAYVHLADERVRSLNPWAATQPRKTAVYLERRVEGGQRCVWGGPVTGRTRASDSVGMSVSAMTWEGWLHRQLLLTDLTLTAAGPKATAAAIITRLATETGGDVGLQVDTSGIDGSPFNHNFQARDIKPALELLESLSTDAASDDPTPLPVEFRIDCYRDEAGIFRKVLRVEQPRLGRVWEDTRLTFGYPDGGLEKWTLTEDGTAAANVLLMLGSGSGEAQPWDVLFDVDAGIDELASGYPSWMSDFRAQDTNNMGIIRSRAQLAMRRGLAAEGVFSGVEVDPDRYLGYVDPGDDIGLDIAHLAFPDETQGSPGAPTPERVLYLTRVLGESVTVGEAGHADTVALTIGGWAG